MEQVSRRSFVKSAGLVGAAVLAGTTATSVASSASADEAQGCTYPDSIAWNAVYDVVVVGFG